MQLFQLFVDAYLRAALYTSHDDDGANLDGLFTLSSFSENSQAKAHKDCREFYDKHEGQLHGCVELAGHLLWLERSGKSIGFRDHVYTFGEDTAALAASAKAMPPVKVVVEGREVLFA